MKRKLNIALLLSSMLLLAIMFFTNGVLPSIAFAAPKDCGVETDTGKRIKCKMENLNDAVDGLVTTVLEDNTGTFTASQKKQLENTKNRARNESSRIKPEDFKQLAKKRKVDCYIQEILGDVEPGNDTNSNGECDDAELCIGDEDGICDKFEQKNNGCAEVLNDGIGDDDGICIEKGKYKEACIEICDTDTIMAEGDETNVDPGKAAEMEQALENASDIVSESNNNVKAFLQVQAVELSAIASCDKNTMLPCQYLNCLINDRGRTSTSKTIEDLAMSAVSLQAVTELCRDTGDQTIPIPFAGGSIDVRIICVPLGLAANGVSIISQLLEVIDDSETADRLDATALCAQDTSDQINEVNALVELTKKLLRQPQGQREGFQEK